LQKKKELRQKGHVRSWKTMYPKRGKNIIFGRGGGELISFLDKNIYPCTSINDNLALITPLSQRFSEPKNARD
jgi:hypothetical protein